jgi:hypothetical protein
MESATPAIPVRLAVLRAIILDVIFQQLLAGSFIQRIKIINQFADLRFETFHHHGSFAAFMLAFHGLRSFFSEIKQRPVFFRLGAVRE